MKKNYTCHTADEDIPYACLSQLIVFSAPPSLFPAAVAHSSVGRVDVGKTQPLDIGPSISGSATARLRPTHVGYSVFNIRYSIFIRRAPSRARIDRWPPQPAISPQRSEMEENDPLWLQLVSPPDASVRLRVGRV